MSEAGGVMLSRADVPDLRAMLTWYRGMVREGKHTPEPAIPQAPDVYLARTAAGIPAFTSATGTGTDSGSAAGKIKKADCKLFRIDDKDPDIDVDPLGVTMPVYNPGSAAIAANQLFLAVRDKPGMFNAVPLGGAAASGGSASLFGSASGSTTGLAFGVTNQYIISGIDTGNYVFVCFFKITVPNAFTGTSGAFPTTQVIDTGAGPSPNPTINSIVPANAVAGTSETALSVTWHTFTGPANQVGLKMDAGGSISQSWRYDYDAILIKLP